MKLTSNYLSSLRINCDKDWLSHNITKLGRGNIDLGINQPLSPGLCVNDVGKNWEYLGVVAASHIYAMEYCSNGIVLLGGLNGHVHRSISYGTTWASWTDLGVIAASAVRAFAYCGGGIVLLGSTDKHVYRSTDYGATWADLGVISLFGIYSMIYCGNGVSLAGDSNGHVYRSTDYGATWADLGMLTSDSMVMAYCDNGIVLSGGTAKHVLRSIDYGATWTDLGVIATGSIDVLAYCGNGIALLGDGAGHVYRSINYGATWADLGVISSSAIQSMSYCGNGVVLFGAAVPFAHTYRSDDYGLTWTDLGASPAATSIRSIAYCGNGIVNMGCHNGRVCSSDVAYKLDECVMGSGDCGESVDFMDFWSDVLDDCAYLPDTIDLPQIVIDALPDDITILKAILTLKYSSKEDDSGAPNAIMFGTIESKESVGGVYETAIIFAMAEAFCRPMTRECGDVHVGNADISGAPSGIVGNCVVNSRFADIAVAGEGITLYDVQVGIRIYFTT